MRAASLRAEGEIDEPDFSVWLRHISQMQHALVAESWSALVNGQIQLLPQVIEQFAKLSEISAQCLPKTAALLEVLALCLDDLRRSGLAPSAAMAMEFAIASLTVDAVCEDPNPSRKQQERRCKQLIQRLQIAREGHNPPPLEDWMREVYNRAATQRSMDGLVHALRALLQHTEQLLEQYFNGSGKPKTLETILERLAQADGIFAMLEIEQAHLAVRRMREQQVDHLWLDLRPVGTDRLEKQFPTILGRCRELGLGDARLRCRKL